MTLLARFGRLFPRNRTADTVRTSLHLDASAEDAWRAMLFYEEVPGRPTPLLRAFLPAPIRTEGAKTRVGAIIRCTYDGGRLEKRITASEPPRLLRFEVGLQALGIEDSISMGGGSYELADEPGGGCTVVLSTRYFGHLRPRWLWRPFERFLAHRLHRHILRGMRVLLERESRSRRVEGGSVRRGDAPRGLVEQRVPHRPGEQRPDDGSAGDPVPP